MEAPILIQEVILIRKEVKVKIVTIIIGNLEGKEEGKLDMEEEIPTILLEMTLEMETTKMIKGENVVPSEGEITADDPESTPLEIEVAVEANLHPGNNNRGMIS